MSSVGKILQIGCFSDLKQHDVAAPRGVAYVASYQSLWGSGAQLKFRLFAYCIGSQVEEHFPPKGDFVFQN